MIEDVHTSNIYFTADYSTVRYSEIGPHTACNDLVLTGRVRGVVVAYNLIHDNIGTRCGSVHIDALDLDMVEGVIRGNRIWACGHAVHLHGRPARC